MNNRYLTLLAMGLLTASNVYGSTLCDDQLMTSLHECEHIVGSLRPDKMGQMRVFASDGSEFTAGQAQWMKSQLKQVAAECAGGNVADASRQLAQVKDLLAQHHRAG
ncbi:MAG TPA: hypothetical protein VNZ06_14430 [Steroidobacteraceae bacterium]|jgi:hypothetical protein|nr:hypothetical protein [Steroidobacteraceae bacterium]